MAIGFPSTPLHRHDDKISNLDLATESPDLVASAALFASGLIWELLVDEVTELIAGLEFCDAAPIAPAPTDSDDVVDEVVLDGLAIASCSYDPAVKQLGGLLLSAPMAPSPHSAHVVRPWSQASAHRSSPRILELQNARILPDRG